MTTELTRSSWIESIAYCHAPDGINYLAIFTLRGDAILYSNVPSTLPGLISAGRVKTVDGSRLSHGAAYCKLVKGKYPSETINDRAKVNELKLLMGAV